MIKGKQRPQTGSAPVFRETCSTPPGGTAIPDKSLSSLSELHLPMGGRFPTGTGKPTRAFNSA